MILVDSNIPMYLVGGDRPMKDRSQRLVQQALVRGDVLVTDVEVFQEILHRYSSIRRLDAIRPAFDVLTSLIERTLSVELPHLLRARDILLAMTVVSARDAIHVAVMEHYGISRIMSLDAGFDQFPGLVRIHTPD